jgi:SAM-dependent methyltransferase
MSSFLETNKLNPRNYQPSLPLPAGFSKDSILEVLTSLSIDGEYVKEFASYATADCERFLYTLDLIPLDAGGRLLEIGAQPYFITLLIRHFRPALQWALVNYLGGPVREVVQYLQYQDFNRMRQQYDVKYYNCNIEVDSLSYENNSFDWVMCCEVLEHLTADPLKALLELKRVLKPGGHLILTTPNAARIENLIAFLEGRNIYDVYSAYGPYGRHNREYTNHELHQLLKHCGFVNEITFTANVHDDIPGIIPYSTLDFMSKFIERREYDLGQYLFTRWNNSVQIPSPKKPEWLYRSYPAEQMANS